MTCNRSKSDNYWYVDLLLTVWKFPKCNVHYAKFRSVTLFHNLSVPAVLGAETVLRINVLLDTSFKGIGLLVLKLLRALSDWWELHRESSTTEPCIKVKFIYMFICLIILHFNFKLFAIRAIQVENYLGGQGWNTIFFLNVSISLTKIFTGTTLTIMYRCLNVNTCISRTLSIWKIINLVFFPH